MAVLSSRRIWFTGIKSKCLDHWLPASLMCLIVSEALQLARESAYLFWVAITTTFVHKRVWFSDDKTHYVQCGFLARSW
jgi:hypothetical protein